jgi:hypothetical protein
MFCFKSFNKSIARGIIYKNITKFSFSNKLPTVDGKVEHNLTTKSSQVQPWVDIENRLSKLKGELVLNDQDKIEDYVLGVVKGYFRTTYKEGLELTSNLSDHGLDSLDSIELAMILEDELGKF